MLAIQVYYICSDGLCKPIEIIIYAKKKPPFTSYLVGGHSKHSKFAITDMREKPVDFFIVLHGR